MPMVLLFLKKGKAIRSTGKITPKQFKKKKREKKNQPPSAGDEPGTFGFADEHFIH